MADHTRKSLELLQEIDDLNAEVRKLSRTPKTEMGSHGRPVRPANVQDRINHKTQAIGKLLKLADVHAQLAIGQELHHIAQLLERTALAPSEMGRL